MLLGWEIEVGLTMWDAEGIVDCSSSTAAVGEALSIRSTVYLGHSAGNMNNHHGQCKCFHVTFAIDSSSCGLLLGFYGMVTLSEHLLSCTMVFDFLLCLGAGEWNEFSR